MFLSEVLEKYDFATKYSYEIVNEKSFDTLGILAFNLSVDTCSFLDGEKYIEQVKDNITMLITTQELSANLQGAKFGLCITENPRMLFFDLHNALSQDCRYARGAERTCIGEGVRIHETAIIADQNVRIGNNVVIEEYVVIRENTVIGDNSIIRAGAKIGGEGFEFKRRDNTIVPVKHLGGVLIGSNVEIQYNSCVDKAVYPWDNTYIGDYTKIDNLVHIGHAVKIDKCVMLVAQSGIGGRTEIGAQTWIGFGATVSNGLQIGEKTRVNIGSVATKNVLDGESVTGNFAITHDKFIQNLKKQLHALDAV